MSEKLNLTLKVWRQEDNSQAGDFITYPVTDVNPHMSFLELLDVLNEKLISEGGDPIAFEHDCREGICGSCAMNINGEAHGPVKSTTACQLHMFNFKDGDLSAWAKQGVLLLNSILTVRNNKPASHRKLGWQKFTDSVINLISQKKDNIVFILWGDFAKSKKEMIKRQDSHLILMSPHPSPFSAYKGFFGQNHFKKVNDYLEENGIEIINW